MNSILIIDDDADIQRLLKVFLKSKYELHFASNGREGLETLARISRPDLILLDLEMPEMDGKIFRKKLNEDVDWKTIPVIYLSANDSYKDEVELFSEFGFLNKPIDKEDLLSVLDSFLRLLKLDK